MKYLTHTLALAAFAVASQVHAELPVQFQLSADAYLYDLEATTDDNTTLENVEYDGSLFGATLKISPTDPDVRLSGDISFRTGSLDGSFTEEDGGIVNGDVDVDRDEFEFRLFYRLTDSIFASASWLYISTDGKGNDDANTFTFKEGKDFHLFPVGLGFTNTEKLGEWYITPKAWVSYVFGTYDSDYSDTTLDPDTSDDDSVSGFQAEVTLIFDRPLSESSSFFTEIGWKYQDFKYGDTSIDLSGLHGRFGYRFSF